VVDILFLIFMFLADDSLSVSFFNGFLYNLIQFFYLHSQLPIYSFQLLYLYTSHLRQNYSLTLSHLSLSFF